MQIDNSKFMTLEQVQGQYLKKEPLSQGQSSKSGGASFQSILEQMSAQKSSETTEVRFSKHAASRLQTRNITLSENQMERLKEGTKKAEEKGINDSLVMVDSLAFIVNVKSGTVITAMDQNETKENVFTNIDGAVIV